MYPRIILLALTGLLLAPGLTSAQDRRHRRDGPGPERILRRMEQRLERMKGPLNLSTDQETRIRQVLRRGATQLRRVLRQHSDRGPERHEAMRRVRWETSDRVHAILSCDQRVQLRLLRREHRGQRRHHRRGRRGRHHRRGSPPDGGI